MPLSNELKVFNHGTGLINLHRDTDKIVEMRPIELHYKADGDIENNPSFCIVLEHPITPVVIAQVSLNMLQQAMAELGYTLYKL